MKSLRYIVFLSMLTQAPAARAQSTERVLTDFLRPAVFSITMVMVHDVVDPPAASRYYAYVMLGAYDIISRHNAGIVRPGAFIKHYPLDSAGRVAMDYDHHIAAAFSILETGRIMLPSGYLLEAEETKFLQLLKAQRLPQGLIDRSRAAGRQATARVIAWSKGDGYLRLSAMLNYTPLKKDSSWYPTPPAYMQAVEPNWRIIRPMVIDSCNQFIPPPLVPVSADTVSAFFPLEMEVCRISKDTGVRSVDRRTIAGFWDCNPFAISTSG